MKSVSIIKEEYSRVTFGTTDSDSELAGSSATSIAEKTALESGQDTVLNARPMYAYFSGIRRTHHSQGKRTSVDWLTYSLHSIKISFQCHYFLNVWEKKQKKTKKRTSIFYMKTVSSVFLRFDIQTVSTVAVIQKFTKSYFVRT